MSAPEVSCFLCEWIHWWDVWARCPELHVVIKLLLHALTGCQAYTNFPDYLLPTLAVIECKLSLKMSMYLTRGNAPIWVGLNLAVIMQ